MKVVVSHLYNNYIVSKSQVINIEYCPLEGILMVAISFHRITQSCLLPHKLLIDIVAASVVMGNINMKGTAALGIPQTRTFLRTHIRAYVNAFKYKILFL